MDEDMYPTTDDSSSPATAGDPEPDPNDKGETMEKETTLIPKSMCKGMELKPGDDLKFKVVSVHDDEVEVEYDDGTDNENKEKSSEEMGGAMDALDRSASGE